MKTIIKTTLLASTFFCSLLYFNPSYAVSFFDGDFSSGWDNTVLIVDDPTPNIFSPGTSTGSITLQQAGGNPGNYRESIHNVDFGDSIHTIGINRNAVYDPLTSGAIRSIDFSIDLLEDPTLEGSSGIQLVLEQNGILYNTSIFGFGNSTWQSFTLENMVAYEFDTNPNFGLPGAAPDGQTPDFSQSGSPITFGYALSNTIAGPGNGSLSPVHRADNWSVSVNPVPLPPSGLLLFSALVGLFATKRAKRR